MSRQKKAENMKEYELVMDCGCCKGILCFRSDERASEVFQSAGLSSSATIIDDTGKPTEGIDTFYGLCVVGKSK